MGLRIIQLISNCVFFQERPPPVPPSRPYTVTGNKKIAFPQNRVMRATFPGNSLNQYTWVCWVYKTNSNQTFLLAPSRRDRSFRSPFIERGDRGGDRFISSPEGLPRGGEKEPHPPCTSHTPRAQVITPLSTQWQQHTDCPSPTPLFTLSPSCPTSPTSPSSTAPKHHFTSLYSTAASNPASTFGGNWHMIEQSFPSLDDIIMKYPSYILIMMIPNQCDVLLLHTNKNWYEIFAKLLIPWCQILNLCGYHVPSDMYFQARFLKFG